MGYTALYRKWRPSTFDEVRGQDHIVTTLKNQIASGRIGHAYLFCGTRGTGKTSIAKIFARAVNCEHPHNGNPCGECAACRAIATGASMNVVEIDAASNNGVDNIRQIRDEVEYSPADGKFRVYIIDEVHMLSTGAFNALLKTLEEPPSYVIFILATTEAHKIPITVLSRCQRYDFRRIDGETIAGRLRQMADAEGIDVEDQALRYVAKKGDGSLRDSISLFDQCVAFYYGEKLTFERVLDVLGAVDNEVYSQFLRLLHDKNVGQCLRQVEELILQGRDLGQFVSDFVWYLRSLLLAQTGETNGDLLDMSQEDQVRLRENATLISEETAMRWIRVLSETMNQMRYSTAKRVLLEITLIKLTRPAMENNMDSVMQRLEDLERGGAGSANALGTADSGYEMDGYGEDYETADSYGADRRMTARPTTSQSAIDSNALLAALTPELLAQALAAAGMMPAAGSAQGSAVFGSSPLGTSQTGNSAPATREPQTVVLPPAQINELRLLEKDWKEIISAVGGTAKTTLAGVKLEPMNEGQLMLVFFDQQAHFMGSRPSTLQNVENYIATAYQIQVHLQAKLVAQNEYTRKRYVTEEELKQKFNVDIIME